MPVQLIQPATARAPGDKAVVVRDGRAANVPLLPTIIVGVGAPSLSIGGPGDCYLDISTGHITGPRTVDSWGAHIYTLSPAV